MGRAVTLGAMPPLRMAAIGLLLVLVTLNLGSFTLSLDLVGWLMVVGGLHALVGLGKWFVWARNLAAAAVVLELVLWISPVQLINVLAATLSRVTALAFVFCVCTALLLRLGKSERAYTITLQVVRVVVPLVTLIAAASAVLELPASLVGLLYPIQLVGTVVLAVVLWMLSSRYSYSN